MTKFIIPGLAILLSFLSAQAQTSIAIIGCHDQHKPAPVLRYFAESKPDYTIWVGDNVYADTKDDPAHIQRQLEVLSDKDGFRELKAASEFMVTWDDHDYGLNNANKHYKFKEESLDIHRKFWDLEDDVPSDRDGIYHARIETLPNGRKIQFIMVDIRFHKERPGPGSDILGQRQWTWLEEQLKQEADLRFLVSGTQVLLNRPSRWEAWTKHGKSRKRLMSLIRATEAKGLVFITGDQHYNEVLKSKRALDYDTYEIMAAGINKTERPGWAGKRVAGPDITVHSAPFMQINWNDSDGIGPHIEFSVTDVEKMEVTLEYRILLSEIGVRDK